MKLLHQSMSYLFLLIFLVGCSTTKDSNNTLKTISMKDKLVLVLKFETKEGQKEAFKKELHDLLEKLAERPNFISVAFHEDIDNPQLVVVHEVWEKESKESFMQKNLADPNFKTYQANVKTLLAAPPMVHFLNVYKEL